MLSRDENTGETGWRKITDIFVTPDQPVCSLTLEDDEGSAEQFGVTAEHPFWVKDSGWTAAVRLLPGDEVFSSKGGWLRVAGGTWLSARQTVYNFKVGDFHTYFVGKIGAWVHNGAGTGCNIESMPEIRFPAGSDEPVYLGYDPRYGHRWSDGGLKHSRLNPKKVRQLRRLSKKSGKPMTVTGGWTETEIGFSNREKAWELTLERFGEKAEKGEHKIPEYGLGEVWYDGELRSLRWRNTGPPKSSLPGRGRKPDADYWTPRYSRRPYMNEFKKIFGLGEHQKMDNYNDKFTGQGGYPPCPVKRLVMPLYNSFILFRKSL